MHQEMHWRSCAGAHVAPVGSVQRSDLSPT
jgi:hypothetical protein